MVLALLPLSLGHAATLDLETRIVMESHTVDLHFSDVALRDDALSVVRATRKVGLHRYDFEFGLALQDDDGLWWQLTVGRSDGKDQFTIPAVTTRIGTRSRVVVGRPNESIEYFCADLWPAVTGATASPTRTSECKKGGASLLKR